MGRIVRLHTLISPKTGRQKPKAPLFDEALWLIYGIQE
jgi:hypothetical protein